MSAAFLAIFSFKFTVDAQILRDKVYEMYCQRDQTSRQWIKIFENLPIGLLLVNKNTVMHCNGQLGKLFSQPITAQ